MHKMIPPFFSLSKTRERLLLFSTLLLLSSCHMEEQTLDSSPGGRLIDQQSLIDRDGPRLIDQSRVGEGERLIDRGSFLQGRGESRLIDQSQY